MHNLPAIALGLLFCSLLFNCSQNPKSEQSAPKAKKNKCESSLTVSVTGDGFTNEVFNFSGVPNNETCLWAVRYYTNLGYSTAQLFLDAPETDQYFEMVKNGLVYIVFDGKTAGAKNISGNGISSLAGGEGRGVDIQLLKPGAEYPEAYYIKEGITTGKIDITEYGDRVKGSFEMFKLVKDSNPGITIDIKGTFDLAFYAEMEFTVY